MKKIKKAMIFTPILSAMVFLCCVIISLWSYHEAVYAVGPLDTETISDDMMNMVLNETENEFENSSVSKEVDESGNGNSEDDIQTATSVSGSMGKGTTVLPPADDAGKYKDGVYEGTGTGFAGEIKVLVTIAGGSITNIEITKTGDGTAYIKKASALISNIINNQNTDVDTVSGATYSSVGIISAVRDALAKAADTAASGQGTEAAGQDTEGGNDNADESKKGKFPYKDGVYYGTAKGFSGDITVAVALQDKTLKAILVTDSVDDESYLSRAKTVAEQMIEKQSTKVDTVSGATYSSKGIKNAVKATLKNAKKGTDGKNPKDNGQEDEEEEAVTGRVPYKEGVCFGTGDGFLGNIEVAVAIADKTIKAVVVTKTEDDEEFFGRARTVIDSVLKKQNTKVDTVSGATFSSKGILEAIDNALLEAKKVTEGNADAGDNNQNTDTPLNPSQDGGSTDSSGDNSQDTGNTEGVLYKNGTYTVSVCCYPDEYEDFKSYNLSAVITIAGDKIISITDLSGDGGAKNDSYIKRAANGTSKYPGVVTQMIEKGNTEGIDAVTGATCSSVAIVDACNQALSDAKKSSRAVGYSKEYPTGHFHSNKLHVNDLSDCNRTVRKIERCAVGG